ncbi:hypothetical protein H6F39_12845 [Anabaena sp. FACHB-1250]|uniref:hypothetical protein n=1 Tax=unclassified Anabaena TaxID=2619674 RepID=UPI001680FC97|nr:MULTISPECIES: hypothetical protein [unclassified Anabaena]MBD2142219.1 hypothetical protein [Anabaena sp. FACHB-1250]MBD2268063.1 hypothetical protein [Anabaena sp. FACHB-1391]
MELMAERLESLKAGVIGSISLGLAFLSTSLINVLWLYKYFSLVGYHTINMVSLQVLLSGVIAGFSGFLFGVTYRYIIRVDTNPHLKTGGILAFGLVRGLTQIEVGWNINNPLLPFLILVAESILWFALAAFALDTAILRKWLKPFS